MRNRKYCKAIPILLTAALCFSGCASAKTNETAVSADTVPVTSEMVPAAPAAMPNQMPAKNTSAVTVTATSLETVKAGTDKDYFSNRDLSAEVDTANAVSISLNGDSASSDGASVNISGSTVTITEEGTYLFSGTLNNGTVIVDAGKDAKVQLVLNNVSMTAETFAPIYVASADKVFITLPGGTRNTLANGGSFVAIDDSNVDAVIFSKDDITLNGSGTLVISSPAGHGIVGKDDVTITGGSYEITSAQVAIRANDNLDIADGTFVLNAGTDGLHCENTDDTTVGAIYIAGGSFTVTAGDDGIHATTTLRIDGGSFQITAAEGMEATYVLLNDGEISISASDDGINAGQKSNLCTPTVEINGGNITVVMGAGDTDGIDANGNIVINGGTVSVTGNSTFDYDGTGTINGGTVIVNGQQVTELPNQMMGGHGGMGGRNGQMGGGQMGGRGMRPDGTDAVGSATKKS